MTAGVVTVAGVKYAAGLYWQPSPDNNIARAARAAARQPGFQANFYCIRPPTKSQPVGQFGLGLTAAQHKSGMPSIGACIASQMPGSWAGAFRVSEGVYFISVRDDLIDPDGDAWYAHDDDAQSRLEQEIAQGGLHHIYAPPEWGVHGTEQGSITSILAGRRDAVLNSVGVDRTQLLWIVGVLLFAGLLYGAYSYVQYSQAQRAIEEAAKQQALLAAQRASAPPLEYPKTWQDSPLPLEYINACERALEKIRARYFGWTANSIACNGTNLSVTWSHADGYAVVPVDGKAVMDPGLSTASANVPLENLKPRGQEALAYYGLIDQVVLAHNFPVHLTLMPDDTVSVPKDAPPPPPPKWRKRSVVYSIRGAPWLRPELFDTMPGLIITSIKQNGDGNFTIEGTLYEKKQPE